MKEKWISIVVLTVCMTAALPSRAEQSMGWSLTGGSVWERRTGPGISLALGGNACTGDFCDSTLDVNFFGSAGGTIGFMYRLIPNLVVFWDFHTSYLNTGMTPDTMKDDNGLLFHTTAGAEFHVPFTDRLEAYLGLGLGYALMRAEAYNKGPAETEAFVYRGVDIEAKVGVDVYPFSRAPDLSLGVLFRMEFTLWPSACIRGDKTGDYCDDPDEMDDILPGWEYADDEPFFIFIGLTAKYTFSIASRTDTSASAEAR
jgi:hypothetical protein